jgi:cholesterol oxidase
VTATSGSTPQERFDVVVVGSGFGGSVTSQRLASAGLRVCVLERGKAYPPGSFARSPYEMERNFWDPSEGLQGMFDVWSFRGLEGLVSSGLGGGSLIYANVLLRKDERWFVHESPVPGGGHENWPISRADLDPHYDAVERMMHPQRYPLTVEPYASTLKTLALRDAARRLGLDWELPPLAVTFGNDGETPVPGEAIRPYEYPNIHHRLRTTCRLTGECDIGCNYGSKNSLDHTYLSAAAHAGAEIRTRSEVRRIAPADGGGYRITYVTHTPENEGRRTRTERLPESQLVADRLVLAAGAFGTPFLLLRNRAALPALSPALGTRFSGNGDLLTFLLDAKEADGSPRRLESSRGPVITSAIRVADEVDGAAAGDRGFYIEDAGYPSFADWMAEAAQAPSAVVRAARFLAARAWAGITGSPRSGLGSEIHALLGDAAFSAGALPLLGMGRDVPDGRMRLRRGYLQVDWTTATSASYFDRVRSVMQDIAGEVGARFEDNPLWHLRRRVITVHPLGGAPMGRHPGEGVVDPFGEVFGHPGLYVADGSALPGPVGANPSLTIAAFADRLAEHLLEQHERRGAAVPTPRPPTAAPQAAAPRAADGRRPAAGSAAPAAHLSFTEEMKGFVALGETDHRLGFERGRDAGTRLMFHLTIGIEDVDHFLDDPERRGVAEGWVECDVLGGRLPVERGTFNLFEHTSADHGDRHRSRMLYRLFFRDGAGHPVTLSGFKDVHDDPGIDVWRDTSTLFVHLYAGHVDEDDGAELLGSGIITIHLPDFAHQLTTFRAGGPRSGDAVRALQAFGSVFLGELWNTYGPRVLEHAGRAGTPATPSG